MSSLSIEHSAPHSKGQENLAADREPDTIDGFFARARREIGRGTSIGRFLARAEDHLRAEGITLAIGTLEQLVEVNKANPETWKPLIPIYQPWGVEADRKSLTLLAYDADDRVVGTVSARIFDWSRSNFHAEASSLRLFYPRPGLRANLAETCHVTAPSAKSLSGRVAFCGAAWWHPQIRGGNLSAVCGRVLRTFALHRFQADLFVAIMALPVLSKGVAARWGYRHAEPGVELRNFDIGPYSGSLIWMTADELVDDVRSFGQPFDGSDVDQRVARRA